MKYQEIVIGTALRNAESAHLMIDMTRPEYFSPKLRPVHEAIASALEKHPDGPTMEQYSQAMEPDVWEVAVSTIVHYQPSKQEGNLQKVKQYYLSSRSMEIARRAVAEASGDPDTAHDSLMRMAEEITELDGQLSVHHLIDESDLHKMAFAEVEDAFNREDKTIGFKIGWQQFAVLQDSLIPGGVYVIAMRSGVGKTTVALDIKRQLEINGYPCGYISMEMTLMQFAMRMAAGRLGVSERELMSGRISAAKLEQYRKLAESEEVAKSIMESGMESKIEDFREIFRRMALRGVRVIFVDYLQIVGSRNPSLNADPMKRAMETSAELRSLAKRFGVSVVALSQVTKQVDQRENKVPNASDVTWSTAIENDATAIMTGYRPNYYGIKSDSVGFRYPKNYLELHIKKKRYFDSGVIRLVFDESKHRFLEVKQTNRAPGYEYLDPSLGDLEFESDAPPPYLEENRRKMTAEQIIDDFDAESLPF